MCALFVCLFCLRPGMGRHGQARHDAPKAMLRLGLGLNSISISCAPPTRVPSRPQPVAPCPLELIAVPLPYLHARPSLYPRVTLCDVPIPYDFFFTMCTVQCLLPVLICGIPSSPAWPPTKFARKIPSSTCLLYSGVRSTIATVRLSSPPQASRRRRSA